MNKMLLRVICLTFSLAIAACGDKADSRYISNEFGIIETIDSPDREWSVILYGIEDRNQGSFNGVEHIRVVSRDKERFAIFRPREVSGYAETPKHPWSPDSEFVVLCDGASNGFVVFSKNGLPSNIVSRGEDAATPVAVTWKGFKPEHVFQEWLDSDNFTFSVSSGKMFEVYRFNISSNSLEMVTSSEEAKEN